MSKKITALILLVICIISSVSVSAETKVKMYAPDGRVASVKQSDVAAWKKTGWYDYPVTTMYTLDGRVTVISSSAVEAWKKVGWYTTAVTKMYAPDGRSTVISTKDVAAWQSTGWYTYPVAKVYAADGREAVVSPGDVSAWLNVGWYATKNEANYHKIISTVNAFINQKSYDLALYYVQDELPEFAGTQYEMPLDNLRTEIMAQWRSSIGCPLAILSSYPSTYYGTNRANIEFCNISHKKIVGFKLNFTLYDVFGSVEKSYYEWYYHDHPDLDSGEVDEFYWNLYGADSVHSIRNIYITEIVYEDGTKWYR